MQNYNLDSGKTRLKRQTKRDRKELKLLIEFLSSRIKLEKKRAEKMIQFCNVWDQRLMDVNGERDKLSSKTISRETILQESLKELQEEARNSAFSHYKKHLALTETLQDIKKIYEAHAENDVAADVINKYIEHQGS